jgi:hypothetical protein
MSHTKISSLNIPKVEQPRYELANKLIKVYGSAIFGGETCKGVTLDYLARPQIEINVSDNIIDLTLYYSEKFLYLLIDTAVKMVAEQVRDIELFNTSSQDIIQNP